MRVALIAAADAENGIGREGGLAWHHPEDLRFFRTTTMGGTLIVGRRTFESLPSSGLPGRRLIVVSRSMEGAARSLDDALRRAGDEGHDTVFVAGGGEIYREAITVASEAIVTRVPGTHGCDVFFPDLESLGWSMHSSAAVGAGPLEVECWGKGVADVTCDTFV